MIGAATLSPEPTSIAWQSIGSLFIWCESYLKGALGALVLAVSFLISFPLAFLKKYKLAFAMLLSAIVVFMLRALLAEASMSDFDSFEEASVRVSSESYCELV